MKQGIFAPLGASQIVAVTASDQRITLPTLGTPGPAIALVSQSADIKSLWIKLGDSSVVGSVTTSMRVLPGSIENPTYIGVGNSETHLSIFGENPGSLILTPGRLFFCDNPADSVDTDAIQDDAVTAAKIADAAITLAKLSAELAAMPFGNDAFTKSLLHFDGADAATTFTDVAYGAQTHAPHVWTAAGNAQIDTAESKFGGASYLGDGSGDRISTPDHADFALGSADWTIEAWFNANGASGGFYSIASQSDGGGSDSSFLLLIINSDVVRIQTWVGSTTFQIDGTTQFNNASNTGWHHVAAVRTGNVLKLFIDGVQEGGDVAISGTINDSAFALTVGARSDTFTAWNGWIDEFRLSVGIARWTADFTPPTLPYGPTP